MTDAEAVRHEVLLHIGTHKTGSTAIQSFLHDNGPLLRRDGVVYPRVRTKWKGHHLLPWALGVDHPHAPQGLDAAELLQTWLNEVGRAHRLILSSEDLEFVPDPARLAKLLTGHAVQVVVYLRRQDDYLASDYFQHVRMDQTRFAGDVGAFFAEHDFDSRFDYVRLLRPWVAAFGEESIRPRSFDAARRRGDVVADFCDVAGIRVTSDMTRPSRGQSNVSLGALETEILRLTNRIPLSTGSRRALVGRLEGLFRGDRSRRAYDIVPTAIRRQLLERYRSSNEQMMERYPELRAEGGLNLADVKERACEELPDPVTLLARGLVAMAGVDLPEEG